MSDLRKPVPAPCIVNEGTLINKKDMVRALETLENVKYVYSVDGDVFSQGDGVVVKVFSSRETSTLVVNGCIFLNVLSFDYLRFSPHKKGLTKIELVEETKILRLVPMEEDAKKLIRSNRDFMGSNHFGLDDEPAHLFDELAEEDDD